MLGNCEFSQLLYLNLNQQKSNILKSIGWVTRKLRYQDVVMIVSTGWFPQEEGFHLPSNLWIISQLSQSLIERSVMKMDCMKIH